MAVRIDNLERHISAHKCCPEQLDSLFSIMIWEDEDRSGRYFYFTKDELKQFGADLIQLAAT